MTSLADLRLKVLVKSVLEACDVADEARIMFQKVNGVSHECGYPTSRHYAPSKSLSVPAVLLLVIAVVSWQGESESGAVAEMPVRVACGAIGLALLVHQVCVAVWSWKFVGRYGRKLISRDPVDGIGPATPALPDRPYIRSLLSDGYAAYNELDLATVIDLLLEPQRFTLRITEEIVPDHSTARHTVTKDIQLEKARVRAPFIIPVAHFPKGVLVDGLEVSVNSKSAIVMSYDESLRFTAALIFTARCAQHLDRFALGTSGNLDLHGDDDGLGAEFRDQLARDMVEIARPANDLSDDEKSVMSAVAPPGTGRTRADELVQRLRANYVVYAFVDQPTAQIKVSYSRTTALHGKNQVASREGRRRNKLAEIRFRLGQFPFQLTFTTALIYECQSYHLRTVLPPGLFVLSHNLYERVADGGLERRQRKSFIGDHPAITGWKDGDAVPPTYMRSRDHRALPYVHFYARNGFHLKRMLHSHVLHVAENPFATLRLAATVLFLSALGLLVAGSALITPEGDYSLRGGVIAVIVSVPAVLASWSRQVFGVEALQRSCLTTQFALRLTTGFSLAGLALAVLQESGGPRWAVSVRMMGPNGWELPVRDGYWLVLAGVALMASAFVWARYNKSRMQYLALRRRAMISVKNRTIGEVS